MKRTSSKSARSTKSTPAPLEILAALMKNGTLRLQAVKSGSVIQLICYAPNGSLIEIHGNDWMKVITAAHTAAAAESV